MIDILFIGGLFPRDEESVINSKCKGTVQTAANALQWSIVKGLDSNNPKPLSLVNAIFVSSYPKHYADFYVKSRRWSHIEGAKDLNVGFLNLFAIRRIWIKFALARKARKWANKQNTNNKAIIVYSMNSTHIFAAFAAKKRDPSIHVCLICPDLPEFMNPGKARLSLYRIANRIVSTQVRRYLDQVDSFVFLTKYMAQRVNVGVRPWITIEGMIDKDEAGESSKHAICVNNPKSVLYTGGLHKVYGVLDLLEAFKFIQDNTIELWLCGRGDTENEVKRAAELDPRIKYFGQVSRIKALELQREADLLVNPRNPTKDFTRYSFPSKLMEYMSSGTPVLLFKLPGIPDEYYRYLFTIDGSGPKAIAESITEILNGPSELRESKARKAREFVLSEKTNIVQTRRILDQILVAKSSRFTH